MKLTPASPGLTARGQARSLLAPVRRYNGDQLANGRVCTLEAIAALLHELQPGVGGDDDAAGEEGGDGAAASAAAEAQEEEGGAGRGGAQRGAASEVLLQGLLDNLRLKVRDGLKDACVCSRLWTVISRAPEEEDRGGIDRGLGPASCKQGRSQRAVTAS